MTYSDDDLALFDVPKLDTRTGDPSHVHVLLPCMAYACEETILSRKGSWTTAWRWEQVTCPDCREFGEHAALRATYRQQGEASWGRWLEKHPGCVEWPCSCEEGGT